MSKHSYKLLVLDIDGTLLDGRGNISAEDREAVDKVRVTGIQVALSTGRSYKACLRILEQLSLDSYHIFFDGALVGSHDLAEEVYVQPLAKAIVKEMVEFANHFKIDLELFSSTQYFAGRETWSTEAHRQFFAIESSLVDLSELCERERIIKGGLVTINAEEEAKAERFKSCFTDRIHFSCARTPAYPGVNFNNILAPQVSKGRALEALAVHLGVSLEEVVAVGDGMNDVSLITSAGLGIAMGNAAEELKRIADHVTLEVDRSGLAAAIKKFLL